MNDLDYESLFNQILIKSRDRRRSLKADLDQAFDVDPRASSEILQKMLVATDRQTQLDGVKTNFHELLKRLRRVRLTREELIAKVDELYGAMRQLLELKDELADGPLPTLTALFREELGNGEFKFSFNVIDEVEYEALSAFRSGTRSQGAAAPAARPEPVQAAPAPVRLPDPPPPPPEPEIEPPLSADPLRAESHCRATNPTCASAQPEDPEDFSFEDEAPAAPPPPPIEMTYDEEPAQVNARLDESFADLPDLGPPPPLTIPSDPEPSFVAPPAEPIGPGPTPSLLDDLDSFDIDAEAPPPAAPPPPRPGYRFGLAPVADEDEVLPPLGSSKSSTDDFFPGPEEIEVTLDIPQAAPAGGEETPTDEKDETYEVEVDVLKILSDD